MILSPETPVLTSVLGHYGVYYANEQGLHLLKTQTEVTPVAPSSKVYNDHRLRAFRMTVEAARNNDLPSTIIWMTKR